MGRPFNGLAPQDEPNRGVHQARSISARRADPVTDRWVCRGIPKFRAPTSHSPRTPAIQASIALACW
jgi:hypothetical protein